MIENSIELEIPSQILHSPPPSYDFSEHRENHISIDEKKALIILTILFFTSGLTSGFLQGISLLLITQGVSMSSLAILSVASLPYSFKLVFAPIIDSLYSDKVGKRRTYVLPAQYLIGSTFLLMSVSGFQNLITEMGVAQIMFISLALHVFSAFCDIAVDGWILTSLSKQSVHYGSPCQCVGSAVGQLIGSVLMVNLQSVTFRNQFFSPGSSPLITVDEYCFIQGAAIIFLTFVVQKFSTEPKFKTFQDHELSTKDSIWQVLKDLSNLWHNKNLRFLMFYLLVRSFPFSPIASSASVRLIQDGKFPTEILTQIKLILFPFKAFTACMVGRYLKRGQESQWIFYGYWFRFIESLCVYLLITNLAQLGGYNANTLWIIILLSLLTDTVGTFLGVSSAGFFLRISDANFGGSYLTLLASADSLGTLVSGSLGLIMNSYLPYDPLVITFMIAGLVFIFLVKKPLLDLSKADLESWEVLQHNKE